MMMALLAHAERQLHELGEHIRLIIIHPNFSLRRVLMSEFASGVYMRCDDNSRDAAAIHQQIEQARHEQGALDLADAAYLVMDDGDRADETALVDVLRSMTRHVRMGRVVLFTRTLPAALLSDVTLREQTRFIPHDPNAMMWDYAARREKTALLEVRALGVGHVLLNGLPVENWDGVLPRSLFFYLIDRGMVTRTEIFQTFWSTLTVREATNVFHVTKRKISEVLRVDLTKYGASYYHISPQIQLSYDVSLFTQLVQESAVQTGQAGIEMLERALALYRGGMLTSLHADWVKQRRAVLRYTYAEALEALGGLLEEQGDPIRALGCYRRAAAAMASIRDASQPETMTAHITRLEQMVGG